MISKSSASECYVYITLPGETKFVTAGKFELTTNRQGIPTGKFIYGRTYLARENAVAIDPLELKLSSKTYETNILKGVFGSLRDASPDYWGRRVIEKYAGKTQLGEIDYLLHSQDDRAGALGFGLNKEPPAPRQEFNQTIELERLQALADLIIADEELPGGADAEQVQNLIDGATSMGGARPKAVVEDHNGLWIVKFRHPEDKWNDARVEHAMLMLARACGLQTSDSKVVTIGKHDALLVKRFDRVQTRTGYRRGRMLSALTLLRADDDYQDRGRWSYVLLVEELRRISSQPRTDASELFRRMCFNALISNIDDHPRNHAVIAMDTEWKLSPAYDLTPSTPISIERRDLALECGDMGRYAHAENLLSQSARFLLEPDMAKNIVNEMEKTITNRWYEVARREGVTEKDCEKISSAFAYPGFRLR
ncbi:MAG: type II toxin-antitoxin system HipA family toxin [Gammaproteobacteria bacterium]|nr:type II toxin-antitoxin system HipA family toxin [Gammaproteobacteria bacterium]